jgi:hypothetical protein
MLESGLYFYIRMNETIYELVKDKFTCVHRGKVQAKGYRSLGRRN